MPDSPDYDASLLPWAVNVRHRPDPNRVTQFEQAQVLDTPERQPIVEIGPAKGTLAARPRPHAIASPQSKETEPSYYDISMLKAPLWKWEIASYFFLGSLSAGSFVLARLAERVGGERYRNMTRVGTFLAFASSLACPPLLIHDLGDPKRFHHMLRVWKPSTPMNVGTWTLVSYSGAAAAAAVREWLRRPGSPARRREMQRAASLPGMALLAVQDAAGIPLALLLAGYTGVLLSCTANPLWCKNPWLGPMFSAGAFSNGAGAISLALACSPENNDDAQRVLEKVRTAAHVAEAVTVTGFLRHAGPKAKPLTHGPMRKVLGFSLAAVIGAEVIAMLPVRGKARRWTHGLSAALGLAGGFALRWAMVYGGHDAANDPHTARLVSRPAPSGEKPVSGGHPRVG